MADDEPGRSPISGLIYEIGRAAQAGLARILSGTTPALSTAACQPRQERTPASQDRRACEYAFEEFIDDFINMASSDA
jgi:hypothetical protein